jgi:hypothetical protein
MKETSTPEFEQFLQHLKYYDENTLGNLSPFFDAKLVVSDLLDNPASIITFAYPETEVDKAQINALSVAEIETAIKKFFSPFPRPENTDSSVMADAFLKYLRSCINLEDARVWEYVPDWQSSDELYDYIAFGFTYIIANRNDAHCLIVHGGYMD